MKMNFYFSTEVTNEGGEAKYLGTFNIYVKDKDGTHATLSDSDDTIVLSIKNNNIRLY